jgi:hypothetical protein
MASVEEENNILQIWQLVYKVYSIIFQASNLYQEDEFDEEGKGEIVMEK